MLTNRKILIGFASLLLLGIASCSLPTDYDAAIERDVDATIHHKEDAKAPQTPADTDVIRIKDDIWLGNSRRTLLGRNNDYTVRSLRTIDSSRRCILQDRD